MSDMNEEKDFTNYEMQGKKKNTWSFIIITIVFFGGMALFQWWMGKSMQANFDVIENNIAYKIQTNGKMLLDTSISVRAKDKNSYDRLMSGFKVSDLEKKKKYEEYMNQLRKEVNRDFGVVSYKSEVSTNDLNISIREKVVLIGFIQKINNDTLKFSLPNKPMKVDSKMKLFIHAPEGWQIKDVKPAPTTVTPNYAMWTNVGEIQFPELTVIKK